MQNTQPARIPRTPTNARATTLAPNPSLGRIVSASAPVTPLLGPLAASPPSLSALSELEADMQPQAMLRNHEFTSGRRVFHVHFGHGFVGALDEEVEKVPPGVEPKPPEQHRVLSQKTHNIHVHFDNPKYRLVGAMKLRAFYAVPKMVVIPSVAALRKQKLAQAVLSTPANEASRVGLVRQLLATGSVREACSLVSQWSLKATFEPLLLLQRLLHDKHLAAAARFAREFGLGKAKGKEGEAELSARMLLHRMLHEKR